MKVLVFELSGDYAHFGVYYSTTSPLTFGVIPIPSIWGVIGAIVGLSKENNSYLKELAKCNAKVAVGLKKPVKKVRMGLNLINTKDKNFLYRKKSEHTPTRYEFLKDSCYRIWFTCDDDKLYSNLKGMLENQKTYYTVSMGLSELIASINYIEEDTMQVVKNSENFDSINSIVPIKEVKENGFNILDGGCYLKERMPTGLNINRESLGYEEFIYDMNAKPLNVLTDFYYKGSTGNVIFINANGGNVC